MTQVDLSEFTIRLANEDQLEELWRAAFVPWSRGQTWEAFREEQVQCKRVGAWVEDGAMKTWVLVKRDEPEGTVYAGCDTFRRKTLVKRSGSNEVEEAYSYGIASVVTPVHHHRKGYASHNLRLLHYILGSPNALPPFPAQWGQPPEPLPAADRAQLPPGIGSILWSDVGSKFYERVTIGAEWPGWVTKDEECQQITWKLRPGGAAAINRSKEEWTWFYPGDLVEISNQLSADRRRQLNLDSADTTIWTCDPASPGILGFVPNRASWGRPDGWDKQPEDEPCGIRLPSGNAGGEEAIVIFTRSRGMIANAVLVTLVHNLHALQIPVLLEALDVSGAELGLTDGIVWGVHPDTELGKAWLGQEGRSMEGRRRDERDGHLLGVAWYGNPEERGKFTDPQMWSWC